ncbi:MAG: type II toxin-antitoxin system HicA family toxin [Spirochaetaceae bacterium]|nr:MAG: type II toxin-antitoxin system HicA family toxin [Spirochaetaceae bacterium]
MTGKDVVRIMRKNGWILDRTTGSHHVMVKENLRSVPVPVHGNTDLGNLAQRILKQAGIESPGR